MQALCTLDGLGLLSTEQIRAGLIDPHPGVREQSVRLAEGRIWLDIALRTSPADPTADRARALHGAGTLANWQSDFGRARAMLDEGYTFDGTAQALGWTRQLVTARAKILKLSEAGQQLVGTGEIPVSAIDGLLAISDVSPAIERAMIERYVSATGHGSGFEHAYWALAAQRNTRILGVFTRLWKRDNKPGYRRFQPRMYSSVMIDSPIRLPSSVPMRIVRKVFVTPRNAPAIIIILISPWPIPSRPRHKKYPFLTVHRSSIPNAAPRTESVNDSTGSGGT